MVIYGRHHWQKLPNWVIIGSGTGLLPVRHQANTWTNDDLLWVWPLRRNFSEIIKNIKPFLTKNAFRYVVCKMSAILFSPQCVEWWWFSAPWFGAGELSPKGQSWGKHVGSSLKCDYVTLYYLLTVCSCSSYQPNCCVIFWEKLRSVDHYRFRLRLVAWPAPSHYLSQCWNIINWILENKHQWNLNKNLCIFIQENALENVLWKMVAILSQPQCVICGSAWH